MEIKRKRSFLYELNEKASNRWMARVMHCGPDSANHDELCKIAQMFQAAPDMLEALEFMNRRSRQPGETINAHYERIADEFHQRHGYLAPGKDDPVYSVSDETRRAAWEEFCAEPIKAIRAAIATAKGE
jgi:hypothetical protein